MQYIVQVVGDDELPEGVNRVIVERPGLDPLLLINGESAKTWGLMRAYEASMEYPTSASVCVPPEWPRLRAV